MSRLKYIITTFCFVLLCIGHSHAQQNQFQAIESEKVAYITKELKLTPAEAQKFFPLYNKYNEEMWDLKREKRGTNSNSTAKTPSSVNSFNSRGSQIQKRDVIAFDAKEVEIKKKYRTQFSQVVGQARASQFFQVVEDFNNILRNELQNRKSRGR
jgi:hypothetical protein